MLPDHGGDGFQVFLFHDAAGGIVRVGKDQQFGSRRDAGFQILRLQPETVLLPGRHADRGSAGENNAGGIRNIAGFRNQRFIAGGKKRPQGDINGFGRADGDQNLVLGAVLDAKPPVQIQGDFPSQLRKAAVGRILGFPVHNRVDSRVADMVRGFEVGLADAEGDGILHGGSHVKEPPDPAGRHGRNGRVNIAIVIQGEITSLWSASSSSKTTPSSL